MGEHRKYYGRFTDCNIPELSECRYYDEYVTMADINEPQAFEEMQKVWILLERMVSFEQEKQKDSGSDTAVYLHELQRWIHKKDFFALKLLISIHYETFNSLFPVASMKPEVKKLMESLLQEP